MKLKKLTAIILSCFMIIGISACKNDEKTDGTTDFTNADITEEITSDVGGEEVSVPDVKTETTEALSESVSETTAVISEDIAQWTKAQIVEAYKNAAAKTHSSVTSQHTVEITKIAVNGEELGGAFDFVKGIISTFISDNSEDTEGITGGYKNLTESDVASAKAYKVEKNTVIEMVMKNQTDGAKTNAHSGSVGHAIDVVGDINTVTSELTELGLPIEISAESTTIHYTNPVIKAVIDENGKIIKGTWSYTIEIRLRDYKVFGADVQSSDIVMNNVITVNGGF